MPALFRTAVVTRASANTAGLTVDLETDAGALGPAAAVMVQVNGATRALRLYGASGANEIVHQIETGRCPVFDMRTTKIVIDSGTSAELIVTALYEDRWM